MRGNIRTRKAGPGKPRGTPAVEDRRRRLDLARKILTARKKTEYRKAVAMLSYNLGVTERKAREYIETLLLVDGIRKKDGIIERVV
jgi:predicted transcriptional regulator